MDDSRKRLFGTSTNKNDMFNRLEATVAKAVNEAYAEVNCNMDEAYRLAKEKLSWDSRFDGLGLNRDRVVDKVREVGSCGGKMDWEDSWLYGGAKRHGS